MRLFVVWLLSLGVAVQGHASVRVMDASCPMQHPVAATTHAGQGSVEHAHMHHADAAHATTNPGAGADHSHPGHDPAGHGQHCQHDMGCHSAAPAVASTTITLMPTPPAMQTPAAPALSFRSHIPPLLARPPALA